MGWKMMDLFEGYSNTPVARVIPNCITKAKSEKRRAFIGDQIDDCRDLSSLFYMLPFQKGYLVNWEHQVSYVCAI